LINENSSTELNAFIEGLEPATSYSLAITSLDKVGNESFPSNILTVETYDVDSNPPTPPDQITLINAAGLALDLTWSGAIDAESAINGYKVYVDGVLFNKEKLINESTFIINGLSPETEYTISIEAIDAAGNASDMRSSFLFSTSAFNPVGNNLGVKAGTFSFDLKPFTYSHGIGVNPDYKGGDVFNSAHADMFEELKPGGIRWGALTANPLNFKDYIGAGKSVTIGKFMNLCNQYNAMTVFCSGVQNATDWMVDTNTFSNFMEYIAGPAGTTYGDIRIAEGYTTSLLENSPGLIFEFGNEVWGSIYHEAEIGANYVAYAEWCREMAEIMRASPYYDANKIKLAYSGRNPSPDNSYGLNDKLLLGDRGEVDLIALSGYLGGNLDYDPAIPTGDSELDYYKNAMELVALNIRGLDSYARMSLIESDKVKSSYLYESNMTTSAYNGRQGQAVISTDYYLTTIEHGSVIPTINHQTGGEWKITNPAESYKRLPLFTSAAMVNRLCKGYVMTSEYSSKDKIYTSSSVAIDYDPVGVHAYHKDGNYTLVLASRDFESDHIVQIDLPDNLSFNASARMYTLSSDGYSSREALVDSTDIRLEDGMFITLPKYAMVFITFKGDDITQEPLPELGNYKYAAQTNIEIKAGTYKITEDAGRLELWAFIDPDTAWLKQVRWQ
ncbi:MAG: hypothetical protein PF450_14755, partial [Bacteroidales bacterium]|nr:hypothetical protein [Bacteroidales bacterium]